MTNWKSPPENDAEAVMQTWATTHCRACEGWRPILLGSWRNVRSFLIGLWTMGWLVGSMPLGGWALGAPPDNDIARKLTEDVAGEIDKKLKEMRSELQSEFDSHDWDAVLLRKESVDSFLASVFLFQEMAELERFRPFRLFHHDYTNKPLAETVVENPPLREAIRREASNFALPPGRSVRFKATGRRYPYCRMDYPVVMMFEASLSTSEGRMAGHWSEPLLVNRGLDFPIEPNRFEVTWGPQKLQLFENHGRVVAATEQVGEKTPVFNNPPQLFSLLDSVRLWKWLYGPQSEVTFSFDSAQSAVPGAFVYELWRDQARVQRAELRFAHGRLARITCQQEATPLLHHSDIVYSMTREVVGKVTNEGLFQPTSRRQYLAGGRRIDVVFDGGSDGQNVPVRLTIECNGQCLFSLRYKNVQYGPSRSLKLDPRDPSVLEASDRIQAVYQALDEHRVRFEPTYYAVGDLAPPVNLAVQRSRLKYNIFAALVARDWSRLRDGLKRYRELVSRDAIGDDMYVYSIEGLTQTCYEFCGENDGWRVASDCLAPAYTACGPGELRAHIGRLIDQNRIGFALLALRAASARSDLDVTLGRKLAILEPLLRQRFSSNENRFPEPNYCYADRINYVTRSILKDLDAGKMSHEEK